MPSIRKQRAKEKRSRQADKMFDVKNLDEMLGSYSKIELESNSEDRSVELLKCYIGKHGNIQKNR